MGSCELTPRVHPARSCGYHLCWTVFDPPGVFPITIVMQHTDEVIALTRVARFQHNFQHNYISKPHRHWKKGDIFCFIFSAFVLKTRSLWYTCISDIHKIPIYLPQSLQHIAQQSSVQHRHTVCTYTMPWFSAEMYLITITCNKIFVWELKPFGFGGKTALKESAQLVLGSGEFCSAFCRPLIWPPW